MKTKKINVFEEQKKWMMWHQTARATFTYNMDGELAQACYDSPLVLWSKYMKPDGSVEVFDMDYYNSLTSQEDINNAIAEIGENFLL